MLKNISTSLLLAAIVLLLPTLALAKTITISNNTDFSIAEIYVSDTGVAEWGSDLMGTDVLGPGEAVQIRLTGSHKGWDLRAVDEDGTAVEWIDLDLTNCSKVGLNADGTAILQ